MGLGGTNHQTPKQRKFMNNTNTKSKQAIAKELTHFTGTTQYYRYSPGLFPTFYLTDGTHYVAESCEAYWLFDYIASHQINSVIRKHPKLQQLQFRKLTVQDSKGFIICEWDTDQVVFSETIQFTDFPLDSIRLWVAPLHLSYVGLCSLEQDQWGWLAYLPSEH